MKTIKQLADELGVHKQTIRDRMKKLELFDKCKKQNGIIFLSDDVLGILIKSFGGVQGEAQGVQGEAQGAQGANSEKYIFHLEEQIKNKDNQIAKLQTLLENQQILTLQANQKIQALEAAQEVKETWEANSNEENGKRKRSWMFWRKK